MDRRVTAISRGRAMLEFGRFAINPAGTMDWLSRSDIVQVGRNNRLHFLNNPADVRALFKQEGNLGKETYDTQVLGHFIGDSLFTSPGGLAWREKRERVMPAFRSELFDHSVGVMVSQSEAMLDDWGKRGGGRPFKVTDVRKEIGGLSARIAAKSFFDFDLSQAQAEKVESSLSTVLKFIGSSLRYQRIPVFIQDLPAGYFNQFRQAKETVLTFIKEVLSADSSKTSLIGLLKEAHRANPENFTKADIGDELRSLLGASIATTTNALTWTLYELGRGQGGYVEGIRRESPVLAPAKEDLKTMVTANASFSESLRLHPPLWVLGRKARVDIELEDGYTIKKAESIGIPLYVVHTRPDYWPDPQGYNPDRFLNQQVDTSAFLPFGYGARSCIGARFAMAEGAIVLNSIARRYDLRTLSRVTPAFSTGMTPKGKVEIEFSPV